MNKKALITGITGQDGSYLAEFLLNKNYEIHGVIRPASSFNRHRIDKIYLDSNYHDTKFTLHYGDLSDSTSLNKILQRVQPDEIYNLGAQSHVKRSFDIPEYTAEADALGTLRILEIVRDIKKQIKFYQASTSELFGNSKDSIQNESTPFHPRSPYAISKLYSYWITRNYKEAHNIYACNGILFNHESPRRGENFVSRKITISASRIKCGLQDKLFLGNLYAKRDWGYAKDFVEAMWLILQQEIPDDYVISTGKNYSVKEFCNYAFKCLDINLIWEGEGVNEVGIDSKTNKKIIFVDPYYFRPTEVDSLLGDASKARKILNWEPKTKFKELVNIMIKHDYDIQKKNN